MVTSQGVPSATTEAGRDKERYFSQASGVLAAMLIPWFWILGSRTVKEYISVV